MSETQSDTSIPKTGTNGEEKQKYIPKGTIIDSFLLMAQDDPNVTVERGIADDGREFTRITFHASKKSPKNEGQ